ncbi:hypothetical protein [Sphingomonas sp.]|uniref:hypothetical protein n=1 Tax=Sphingomonas sp. TaxID=28214 RepID=UPI002BF5B043|nr:hypothetical protein [Sphingomonas sp.]HWK36067.1 hypothetical protein [Sphingomonas sp.]
MSEEQNEIMAAAKDAKARKERARSGDKKGNGWSIGAIGLGVGVGSAAVAAALLYAGRNRGKRDDD